MEMVTKTYKGDDARLYVLDVQTERVFKRN